MPAVPNKSKSTLADKIAKVPQRKQGPLWAGPCGEGALGGVTQSMLGRYLSCPERFRVYAVEGLQTVDSFSAPLEFGNMWHACEESIAKGNDIDEVSWCLALHEYCMKLYNQHPMNREKVDHWYSMCKAMFPLYVKHWAEHDDMRQRVPLMSEQVFDVPYKLPSGRVVRLRGKFDSVDLVEGGPNAGVWLMENKTKGTVNKKNLERQLFFDLQTMLYLIALDEAKTTMDFGLGDGKDELLEKTPVRGVRYNVVRRSQHKSVESLLKKINDDTKANRIEEWFARWNVEVSQHDIDKFKQQCLNPVLENLCDDYEWWKRCYGAKPHVVWCAEERCKLWKHHIKRHFRFPYGVYSPVAEGGFGDVDAFLDTGSTAGLRRAETLFPELQ